MSQYPVVPHAPFLFSILSRTRRQAIFGPDDNWRLSGQNSAVFYRNTLVTRLSHCCMCQFRIYLSCIHQSFSIQIPIEGLAPISLENLSGMQLGNRLGGRANMSRPNPIVLSHSSLDPDVEIDLLSDGPRYHLHPVLVRVSSNFFDRCHRYGGEISTK